MKEKDNKPTSIGLLTDNAEKNQLQGYPDYPASEDIYKKYLEEKDINPEDITKAKEPNENSSKNNEKGFDEDVSGSDLDVPGSELDNSRENIGSEDEENDYYSLGGDDHSNLDEYIG